MFSYSPPPLFAPHFKFIVSDEALTPPRYFALN